MPEEDMSPEAVIARAIARRGEIFDEFRLLVTESPRTYDLISRTAGYLHHYKRSESAGQQLSSFSTWTGLFAPKGTPRSALERLNAEVAKALNDPTIRERYAAVGALARPGTPAELAELTRRTRDKMARVIRQAGITGE